MSLLLLFRSTSSVTVNAGNDQNLATGVFSTTLSGTSDGSTFQWTQVDANTAVVFGTPTALTTTVTSLVAGKTYTFRLTANGSTFDDVVVTTAADTIAPTIVMGMRGR